MTPDTLRITVLAKPNAKRARLEQVDAITYRVDIDAPPRQGKANDRLREILAEHFRVRPWQVRILLGATSREKVVEIDGGAASSAEHSGG